MGVARWCQRSRLSIGLILTDNRHCDWLSVDQKVFVSISTRDLKKERAKMGTQYFGLQTVVLRICIVYPVKVWSC